MWMSECKVIGQQGKLRREHIQSATSAGSEPVPASDQREQSAGYSLFSQQILNQFAF